MIEETMVEEKKELCTMGINWEEIIERKIDMLYEELLDFRESFNYIQGQEFIRDLRKEKEELEKQLSDKTSSIQQVDNQQCNSYRERYEKLDRFRGVR